MIASRLPLVLFACGGVSLVSSCSGLRKESATANRNLFVQTSTRDVLTDETIDRLQAIADDPASRLPGTAPPDEDSVAPPTGSPAPENPAEQWADEGWDPRSVHPGDVFSEHAGPVLHKALSLGDTLSEDRWKTTLSSLARTRHRRMPLTLSIDELSAIGESLGPDYALPTRSVALDVRTETIEADSKRLSTLFEELAGSGEGDERLRGSLAKIRKRLSSGERLFVITSVTRSDSLEATYPGAPVGSRDADLVRNAVAATYPHLDRLEATKEEHSIRITRDPEIYWEFEIRELKLDDDRFVIDEEAVARL